jgi:hypothetical protein
LPGRELSTLELLGVRAFGPSLQDDVGCRRPAKVLAELFGARKFDEHAAEVEEEKFGANPVMLTPPT